MPRKVNSRHSRSSQRATTTPETYWTAHNDLASSSPSTCSCDSTFAAEEDYFYPTASGFPHLLAADKQFFPYDFGISLHTSEGDHSRHRPAQHGRPPRRNFAYNSSSSSTLSPVYSNHYAPNHRNSSMRYTAVDRNSSMWNVNKPGNKYTGLSDYETKSRFGSHSSRIPDDMSLMQVIFAYLMKKLMKPLENWAGVTLKPVPITDRGTSTSEEPPPALFREPPALFREPPAVFREPPAVFREPPAVFREPPAVFREPPADFREPPADFREPSILKSSPLSPLLGFSAPSTARMISTADHYSQNFVVDRPKKCVLGSLMEPTTVREVSRLHSNYTPNGIRSADVRSQLPVETKAVQTEVIKPFALLVAETVKPTIAKRRRQDPLDLGKMSTIVESASCNPLTQNFASVSLTARWVVPEFMYLKELARDRALLGSSSDAIISEVFGSEYRVPLKGREAVALRIAFRIRCCPYEKGVTGGRTRGGVTFHLDCIEFRTLDPNQIIPYLGRSLVRFCLVGSENAEVPGSAVEEVFGSLRSGGSYCMSKFLTLSTAPKLNKLMTQAGTQPAMVFRATYKSLLAPPG